MCDMVSLSDKISARFLVPRTLRNVVAARSLVEWLQIWKDAVGEVEVLSLVATYIYTYKYIPINIACRELKAQQKRGKKMARKEREWKKKNVQCYNMRMHANVLTALALTLRKTHMYCWLYLCTTTYTRTPRYCISKAGQQVKAEFAATLFSVLWYEECVVEK